MKARIGAFVLLLAVASPAAPAPAQGPQWVDPDAPVLTLDAAAALALKHSPSHRRSLNAVESAEHAERRSMGMLLPGASLSLGYKGYTTRNKTAFDEMGRPLEEADVVENTTSSASQAVSGTVELLNIQGVRRWRGARAQRRATFARAAVEAAQLRAGIGREYYAVVQREMLVAVEERAVVTVRDQLVAIRELLRVATRQPTDVMGAELDLARAERRLQRARGEAEKAHLALRLRMGVPSGTPFRVVPDFPPVFDPSGLDPVSLIQGASSTSPRLAEQHAVVAAAEQSLSAARAARYPALTGSYGYSRGTNARDYGAFGKVALPNSGWSFGLELRVPLLGRFQSSATIGEAAVESDNARARLRETRLEVEQEVRAALIDLESAYTAVRLAERSANTARERLRQGSELYRLGHLSDYTALQQMAEAAAQQERITIDARYDFWSALLSLEDKVGVSLAPAVDG